MSERERVNLLYDLVFYHFNILQILDFKLASLLITFGN